MANNLYLMRHAESEMNTNPHLVGGRSNESPLTQRGIRQAKRLGEYLLSSKVLPTRVYVSPAVRTVQTATYTLEVMGIEIEPTIVDAIQELDQGTSVGKLRTDVYTSQVLTEIDRQGKDFKLEGGESMNEVGARMLNWVNTEVRMNDASEDENTFVFSHGFAIKSLASTLHGWSRLQTYETPLENTSVSLFRYHDNHWQLEYVGATPHLDQSEIV